MASDQLINELKAIVGPAGWREGAEIDSRNYQDWMGARAIIPPLLLRPASTIEVSGILAACHKAGQAVAPQ